MTNDTIHFTEVIACIEALEDNVQKHADYELLKEKYILPEKETKENEQHTTYGMLKETLDVLES